jgi:hypothetical protein
VWGSSAGAPLLPCLAPGGGAVALWALGAAFASGAPVPGARGAGAHLPLPTLAGAAAQGVPLACGARLCGGSAEDPATGIPHVPRPVDFGGAPFVNAVEAGCANDGQRDATACLQALLAAHANVFLPFGIYLVSDTLAVRGDATVLGEGLSVLRLAPASPGFGNPAAPKALLAAPANSTAAPTGVRIADVALWNMDCGNEGVVLLEWAAPAGSLHDVNMLVAATAAAKAVVVGGGGYFSNTWWVATMVYQPDRLHRLARAAVPPPAVRGGGALPALLRLAPPAPACAYTQQGVVVSTPGPLFWAGLNLEHSIGVELEVAQGSRSVLLAGLQTEEARVALVLNGTRNAVVWGSLNAFWDASATSPEAALAERAGSGGGGGGGGGGAPGGVDCSYRAYGLSVPISASQTNLFVDAGAQGAGGGYVLPATELFASATAILNV